MANPVKIIDILSQQTTMEHVDCDDCEGTGEVIVLNQESGYDLAECRACLGSGYNQLGLILRGILKPPADGYGPVELRDALADYIAESEQKRWIQEANDAIRNAELAIAETQGLVEKAKACLVSATTRVAAPGQVGEPVPEAKTIVSVIKKIS